LIVLSVGALCAGLVFAPHFYGHGFEEFWKGAIGLSKDNHLLHDMHEIPSFVGYIPTLMMVGGFVVAYLMYMVYPGSAHQVARANPLLYKFLLHKWYFDELYDFLFVRPAQALGRLLWKKGDGAIIDGWGPDGVSARVLAISRRAVVMQSGYVYHYAFAMLIGVAVIITWYLVGGVH
jgi:NADH-quinone oxidoreductase subunit L